MGLENTEVVPPPGRIQVTKQVIGDVLAWSFTFTLDNGDPKEATNTAPTVAWENLTPNQTYTLAEVDPGPDWTPGAFICLVGGDPVGDAEPGTPGFQVLVQPGAVYGPGDRGPLADAFVSYLRGELPLVPEKNAYCWGHVADIARAHILVMERGRIGESYIISGPCHELSRVLAVLQQLTGLPLPRLHTSPRLLETVSRLMELVDRFHPLEGNFSPETLRVGAGATYLGTNAKARAELGISMRPIEEGLRESLSWYRRLAGGDGH
jgi:hypothetical protein